MKFILLLILSFQIQAAPITVKWWHSMNGSRGDTLNELVKRYNSSQSKYIVVPEYKGNYTEALNASIAAYRAKKHPHLVQVFEVGTQTMMDSGVVYPVEDLLNDQKIKVDWKQYLQPVLSYYQTSGGKLLSMPFNSSTPIMYINQDLFNKAKIKEVPKTWEELEVALEMMNKAGVECGVTFSWQSWILLENYSAIHDIPFASAANGFDGHKTRMTVDNPKLVSHLERMANWHKRNLFRYEGRGGDPARNAFVAGRCAVLMESSAGYGSIEKLAKFKWSAAAMPFQKGAQPKNSIIGGATLWVFNNHKPEEYAGVADFFQFIAKTEIQAWWHQQTGYLPLTLSAYDQLKKEGYYKKVPVQEIGILQLTRGTPNENSKGVRLGGFTQIRDVIDEELEKVWAGKIEPKVGVANIVARGNQILQSYEQRYTK